MQQPTCTNVRIRSTADAHKIFSAVQQGLLHLVTRRLDADERQALRSGCIYAWEERGPHTENTGLGIERFTEGRRWSPSRVREEFLFYYEKYSPPPDIKNPGGKSVERKTPRDWDPLVKQTYSVWVETEKGRRKWHLTAYFTQATIDQLNTVDDIPRVRDVLVPDGLFKSTRTGKSHLRTDGKKNSGVSRAATSRSYAPFPSSRPNQAERRSPTPAPVFMHEPYRARVSTEPQSPTHDVPSCPASPHDTGEGSSNLLSHPNQLLSVQDYHLVPSSQQNSFAAYNPFKADHAPIGRRETLDYYPSRASSSSWSNDSGIYGSSSPQRTPEIGVSPPSPSSPLPSAYNLLNLINSTNDNSLRYIYPPPAPPVQNSQSHFSASYSSGSSFVPMSSPPSVDLRGGNLPVYPIFDDNRPHVASSFRELALPVVRSENSSLECALAPLSKIQRPSRYRRDPVDEKTLRLLHMLQSSP